MNEQSAGTQVGPYVFCRGERFKRYLAKETLHARIREIAAEINTVYAGKTPILIAVLNGAFMFFSDLLKEITIECEVDFIKLSSYGDAKVSSGNVSELKSIDASIEDRHVIVVEDIVDTGLSMAYILKRMAAYRPASLSTAVLLHKKEATRVDVRLDYVAFTIPNLFVLGYGLDYGQLGRNLPEIYILDQPAD
ncbi:MAG: hypoxanthine phosphoribosyltransferase [Rhodothermales bacterium]